jgi:RNA polymerase sigma factor (sigma-70 family)
VRCAGRIDRRNDVRELRTKPRQADRSSPGSEGAAAPWRRGEEVDDARVAGLLARDPDTIRAIVDEFGPRLIQVAYRYLYGRASLHVDPEEVVQSAFGSFFRHDPGSRFEIGTCDELWSLLVVITRRKCRKQRRYWSAAMRAKPLNEGAVGPFPEPLSNDDPVEMAAMRELIDRTLDRFDPRSRQVVELSLQGLDTKRIAAELRRSERTVQRVRNGLKGMLRDELKTLAGSATE